jgi:hypothetical protein
LVLISSFGVMHCLLSLCYLQRIRLGKKVKWLNFPINFWFVLTETDEYGNCTAWNVLELRLYDSAWMRTNQKKQIKMKKDSNNNK